MRIMSMSSADPMTFSRRAHPTTEASTSFSATSANPTASNTVSSTAGARRGRVEDRSEARPRLEPEARAAAEREEEDAVDQLVQYDYHHGPRDDSNDQCPPACWQPAKVAHFETREIMGWMEVWRAP